MFKNFAIHFWTLSQTIPENSKFFSICIQKTPWLTQIIKLVGALWIHAVWVSSVYKGLLWKAQIPVSRELDASGCSLVCAFVVVCTYIHVYIHTWLLAREHRVPSANYAIVSIRLGKCDVGKYRSTEKKSVSSDCQFSLQINL